MILYVGRIKIAGKTVHNKIKRKQKEETQALSYVASSKFDSSLEKTKNIFSGTDNRIGRVTVEVLDDDSPDSTPRQFFDLKKSIQSTGSKQLNQKIQQPITEKFTDGTLPFQSEKTRVYSKADTFVPAPSVTVEDVNLERDRLSKLEETVRQKKIKYSIQQAAQEHIEVQESSVLKIQALFRGYLGRKKFMLTKKLSEMIDDRTGHWVEVRDKSNGDVWFYNTVTGVSQWERPTEMKGVLATGEKLKKLPKLHPSKSGSATSILNLKNGSSVLDANGKAGSGPVTLPSLENSSIPSASVTIATPGKPMLSTLSDKQRRVLVHSSSSVERPKTGWEGDERVVEKERSEEETEQELRRVLGVNDWNPPEALSKPDGTFKPQLRETIMSALSSHRFNSMSTVLADERLFKTFSSAASGGGNERRPDRSNGNGGFGSTPVQGVDVTRPQMVAVLTMNKRKPKKLARLSVDASASLTDLSSTRGRAAGSAQTSTTRPNSAPDISAKEIASLTVRDVTHPGFERGGDDEAFEKQDVMCFGCWSAGGQMGCALHRSDQRLKPSQTMLLCRNWELAVMRRRYRSEEIQEVYMKKAASLKYDNKRKRFLTVAENRHPIYRLLRALIDRFNFRSLVNTRVKRWLHSFTEEIRAGKVKPFRTGTKAKRIRVRRSLKALGTVAVYTNGVRSSLPIPPITGYSYPEQTKRVQYLFNHVDHVLQREVDIIVALPYPKPVAL